MPYTREEIDKLFLTDSEGRFLNLILPCDALGPEKNMIGKKQLELSLDEVVRIKQYAAKLFEEALAEETSD